MSDSPRNEASKPNPELDPFSALIGAWKTTGTHPMVPGKTFHGRTSFEWIEGGAFVMMRTEIDEPEIPSGISIFGTDDKTKKCSMVYFDERGVSRLYETSIKGKLWEWWRNAADMCQRCAVIISEDGQTMESRGELSRDGRPWEQDLTLTYTRAD